MPNQRNPPANYRLSPALREFASQIGNTEASGVRALILLGAQAAGLDLRPVLKDIRKTMGEDLHPAILQQIVALYQTVAAQTQERHMPRSAADPGSVAPGDTRRSADLRDKPDAAGEHEGSPLDDVGFSFDDDA